MSAARVEFMFDFGSPNAYLSHRVIPSIEARSGATFAYVPILLGGLFKLSNNRSPVEAFVGVPKKLAYGQVEMRRFIARHGATRFRMNPFFPVNTLKIMRGAVAAEALDCAGPYIDAMFAAMWEDGLDMNDTAQIEATLAAAGLDARALLEMAQQPEVKARLQSNTQSAYDRGAFGSPTFFVGEEMFFGKDSLRDVEEEIARQPGPSP